MHPHDLSSLFADFHFLIIFLYIKIYFLFILLLLCSIMIFQFSSYHMSRVWIFFLITRIHYLITTYIIIYVIFMPLTLWNTIIKLHKVWFGLNKDITVILYFVTLLTTINNDKDILIILTFITCHLSLIEH